MPQVYKCLESATNLFGNGYFCDTMQDEYNAYHGVTVVLTSDEVLEKLWRLVEMAQPDNLSFEDPLARASYAVILMELAQHLKKVGENSHITHILFGGGA